MAKGFPNTGVTVVDSSADLPVASAALEGVLMFQKDSNELKICDGSGWVSVVDTDTPNALVMVAPTSVAGSGVSVSNGVVSVSAATSASLNGVFSSAFDNYKVLIDTTNASVNGSDLLMRFRSSGTDYSGADYYFGGNYGGVTGTVGTFSGNALTRFQLAAVHTSRTKVVMDIFKPFTTEAHVAFWAGFGDNLTWQYSVSAGGSELNFVARDGFTVYSSSGNFTGKIRVYGYRNSI